MFLLDFSLSRACENYERSREGSCFAQGDNPELFLNSHGFGNVKCFLARDNRPDALV